MGADWSAVWQELRAALANQPRCSEHAEFPCVRTLSKRSVNDLLVIDETGITVRSHETGRNDFIPVQQFERWWNHLAAGRVASLKPGDRANPDPDRSRLVGAVFAVCLPKRVKTISMSEIALRK